MPQCGLLLHSPFVPSTRSWTHSKYKTLWTGAEDTSGTKTGRALRSQQPQSGGKRKDRYAVKSHLVNAYTLNMPPTSRQEARSFSEELTSPQREPQSTAIEGCTRQGPYQILSRQHTKPTHSSGVSVALLIWAESQKYLASDTMIMWC